MNINLSGNHKSAGFAHFGLFIIVFLLLVGVMGYGAYRAMNKDVASNESETVTVSGGSQSADDGEEADLSNIKEVDPTEGP